MRPPRTKAFHATAPSRRCDSSPTASIRSPASSPRAQSGFVRASLAVGMPNYSPAAALKFLLDGPHPSQNLLLHQSLDKQASRDFFERAPTNHTLTPTTFPNTLMLPLLRFWLSPISHPIELQRLDHLADVTSDGAVVERACAPELVYLYGADEVRNDPASTDDFRSILADIPSGSLLYRMYGKTSRDGREGLHRLGHARVSVRRVGVRGPHPGLPARDAIDEILNGLLGGATSQLPARRQTVIDRSRPIADARRCRTASGPGRGQEMSASAETNEQCAVGTAVDDSSGGSSLGAPSSFSPSASRSSSPATTGPSSGTFCPPIGLPVRY